MIPKIFIRRAISLHERICFSRSLFAPASGARHYSQRSWNALVAFVILCHVMVVLATLCHVARIEFLVSEFKCREYLL